MRKLAIVIAMLVISAFPAQTASVNRIAGLGVDRAKLTETQLFGRAETLQRNSDFYLLRRAEARIAPRRIFADNIWSLIQESAKRENLDPMIIASIIFIESYGDPLAKSPTGPAGIGQISKASAKDLGLVIKDVKIGSHKEPVWGWRGKGKNRKRIIIRQKTVNDYRHIDERLEPAKAIPAMARRIASRVKIFGRTDFAIQEYHDGAGRVLNLISLYTGIPRPIRLIGKVLPKFRLEVRESTVAQIIADRKISYAEVFFKNTPVHKPAVFKFLSKLEDYGATYYFNVMEAKRLLTLFRENSAAYDSLCDVYRNRFDKSKPLQYRMWTYFTPEQVEELRFNDLFALRLAKKAGRLVDLPWPNFGFYPRLEKPSQIAEKDMANQREYIALEEATAGCLFYIIQELKLLQGSKFKPLEINSLVRTDETQSALHSSNSNSKTLLPTHTMGKAFDLPLRKKSSEYKRDLLFILYDLEIAGRLAFIKEGTQDTIHVVSNPAFDQFFSEFYRQVVNPPTRR
jgi:hypothetical protein